MEPLQVTGTYAARQNGHPVFSEVFYPFELGDAEVLSDVRESVRRCKEAFVT